MAVLNASLYGALRRHFGETGVTVAAEGQPIEWRVVRQTMPDGRVKVTRRVEASGEEYVVRCPFCKDHRPRLWINHRWGHYDIATGKRHLWLAQCWNEQCLSSTENQRRLFDMIYVKGGARSDAVIREVDESVPRVQGEVSPPGLIASFRELRKNTPNHHALEYLRSRYFDPFMLERVYGVGYCVSSRYYHAQDRIYIPITQGGKLLSWQCRYIGDDVQGRSFNEMGVPKYYTCPGAPRRGLLYNWDQAIRHPTVVLVEGPADVWNFGPMALGLLSSKVGLPTLKKLTTTLKKRFGDEAAIVIMLDPEWDVNARKRKRHPMHDVEERLDAGCRFRNVVTVWLPEGYDPGSMDRNECRRLVKMRAAEQRVNVTFRKPCLHAE